MTAPDFTIADVLAWARTKPADEGYTYGDIANCAICQFLRETGRALQPEAGGDFWDDQALDSPVEHELDTKLADAIAADPFTFGAFADRLEALAQ